MDNKLSELSKPVAWTWNAYGMQHVTMEADESAELILDGVDVNPLYSQEYVSALLADNEYMRWRIKEIDLLFGQMLLTMQAAVIEIEHGEGPNAAMAWIVNKLAGHGEFAPDSEKTRKHISIASQRKSTLSTASAWTSSNLDAKP
ncbi:hypothetical protein M8494_19745 [Serratia ureilytica]